jgi:hypothetical protein
MKHFFLKLFGSGVKNTNLRCENSRSNPAIMYQGLRAVSCGLQIIFCRRENCRIDRREVNRGNNLQVQILHLLKGQSARFKP